VKHKFGDCFEFCIFFKSTKNKSTPFFSINEMNEAFDSCLFELKKCLEPFTLQQFVFLFFWGFVESHTMTPFNIKPLSTLCVLSIMSISLFKTSLFCALCVDAAMQIEFRTNISLAPCGYERAHKC
jgi:hypothetical protein